MKKYTSGYHQQLLNFVIQNLPEFDDSIPESSIRQYKIALNILQRGYPTQPSKTLLQEGLGISNDKVSLENLISDSASPQWMGTIRGGDVNVAKYFYDEILTKEISPYVGWLLQPEAEINEILGDDNPNYRDERVDFYCPSLKAVIEIDGSQHGKELQKIKDTDRDSLFLNKGIKTYRIPATDIYKGSIVLASFTEAIREAYKSSVKFSELSNSERKAVKLTAIYRLQLVILELLLVGQFTDNRNNSVAVYCEDATDFVDVAKKDLFELLNEINQLGQNPRDYLGIEIKQVASLDELAKHQGLKIKLGVSQRWTDQPNYSVDTIYVGSDYICKVPTDSGVWADVNHFQVQSTDDPITYQFKHEQDESKLELLLDRLFDLPKFRQGQWQILSNYLSRHKTLGVLPTGGGKSVCYQLPALLQAGVTLVIAPLKSLMRDQIQELKNKGIARVEFISGDDSAEDRSRKMKQFGEGKFQILLISPERLQLQVFRNYCENVNIVHAVVDEVHCLSEWGHDFRLSYLNLANTLNNLCLNGLFLGLTATASINVISDIQNEFNLDRDDIKYRLDLSRKNLKFQVVCADLPISVQVMQIIKSKYQSAEVKPSGIIFTPHVNGILGCYRLYQQFERIFPLQVGYFSGSKPRELRISDIEFEETKKNYQDQFKAGAIRLLCATKAFGMGVNKRDVRFTVHAGIPSSVESLYQEAGRAGRDEGDAECIVVRGKDDNRSLDGMKVNAIFSKLITPKGMSSLIDDHEEIPSSDLKTQLWLMSRNLEGYSQQLDLIKKLYNYLKSASDMTKTDEILVEAKVFGGTLEKDRKTLVDKVQRSIYRLSQVGVIHDWTVEDFIRGIYRVKFNSQHTLNQMERRVLSLAERLKSVKTSTLDDVFRYSDEPAESDRRVEALREKDPFDKAIYGLLYLNHRHFNYNRRTSLKNVHDICTKYDDSKPDIFRRELEGYFRIDNRTNWLHRFVDAGIEKLDEWEKLIYNQLKGEREILNTNPNHLLELNSMVNRFLESYESNMALDLISVLVKSAIGEYKSSDSGIRLRTQLIRVANDVEKSNAIRGLIYRVGISKAFSEQIRFEIAQDILAVFPSRATARQLHDVWPSAGTEYLYINKFTEDLSKINQRV